MLTMGVHTVTVKFLKIELPMMFCGLLLDNLLYRDRDEQILGACGLGD